jgi:molecular chaperone DnaK
MAELLRRKASERVEPGSVEVAGVPAPVERTGSERREFARVPVELVVSMRFESLAEVVECKTLDLSRGGVFIGTRSPRPEGTKVRLDLQIGERRMNLAGVVVRSVEPSALGGASGMGVMFTELTAGQTMLLEAVIAQGEA